MQSDKVTAQDVWDFLCIEDKPKKVDAILLLGSQDDKTSVRAAELFHAGYAPLIVTCGGRGSRNSNQERSEAQILNDKVLELDVPDSAILIEGRSANTAENIIFGVKLARDSGLELKSVAIVNRPFVMARSVATFSKIFPDIKCLLFPCSQTLDEYIEWIGNKLKAEQRLKEEVLRLVEYAEFGYLCKVEVPKNILDYCKPKM